VRHATAGKLSSKTMRLAASRLRAGYEGRERGVARGLPSEFGEQTVEVLAEFGFAPEENRRAETD
jgi:hypothetical protein